MSMSNAEVIRQIHQVIKESSGDGDYFAETLRHRRIPHISFSQVHTVEFCQYRYYLQYVRLEEPRPTPAYYTKGKVMHQLIAQYYLDAQNGRCSDGRKAEREIARNFNGEDYRHLMNAFQVHLQYAWKGCEILTVERPFVMDMGSTLPPVVGVIDLILKQGNCYLLVDHKTGRDFYADDELQVAIYDQYIQAEYGSNACRLYYDHYRWVNHLDLIRKPAFQRTEVTARRRDWPRYLARMESAFNLIKQIQSTQRAARSGECYRCPYRKQC